MTVTSIEGPSGSVPHLIPSVWWRDDATLCVFLDNPRDGNWLILTLDVDDQSVPRPTPEEEAIPW